jgi:uncharacterized membrane protein YobD (UPF0266 family)
VIFAAVALLLVVGGLFFAYVTIGFARGHERALCEQRILELRREQRRSKE